MKDVTQVIKEAREKGQLLVSVQLDVGQQYKRKSAYLLLYANDQALGEPNSVAASLQRYDPLVEGLEPSRTVQPNSSSGSKGRNKREAALLHEPIHNNELPEVDYGTDGYRKDDLWESTWYLALKPKPKSGKKEKKGKLQKEEKIEEIQEPQVPKKEITSQVLKPADSAVIKLKDSRTGTDVRKPKQRNEGKNAKKHKGITTTLSPVLSFDEQTMRKARRRQWGNTQHRGCSRRNLRVDFADIGWSEWVIAPRAFDAYYCAGTCGFPMPKVGAKAFMSLHCTSSHLVYCTG